MDLKYIFDGTEDPWISLTLGSVLRKVKVLVPVARILGNFA
jgi:hypothetical protein